MIPGIIEAETAIIAIKADNFNASNSSTLSILFTFYRGKAMFKVYTF